MKQEFFEITDSTNRKPVVRQDRYELSPNTGYIELSNKKIEVANVTPFGFAAIIHSTDLDWFMNIDLQRDVYFTYMNNLIQTINFRPVRKEKSPNLSSDEWIVGCEIQGQPLNVESLHITESVCLLIKEQNQYQSRIDKVPPHFKALVFEMKNWLTNLKLKIDTLEHNTPRHNRLDEENYNESIINNIGKYLGLIIPTSYSKIPSTIDNLSAEQKEAATNFIREQLGPLIYGAPFANRAYYKPRGYAGDYEMMNHLYRDEGVGNTLFDRCMHRYFIDEPAGQAVKNRGYYLLSKIEQLSKENPKKKHFKIVSIASGPAMEVQLFLEKRTFASGATYEFHFIDQDEESLKHAQKQILSIDRFVKTGFKFNFHNLAIKNIIARGVPELNCDLIYSAGLFDYFTEPVATAAAKKFIDSLQPDGTAIIGNFSKDNPCSIFMELALDWQLIYRSPQDLERIFSPVCKKIDIEKEPLGINLFAILKK